MRWSVAAVVAALAFLGTASAPSAHADEDIEARFRSVLEGYRLQHDFPGATAAFALADGTVGVEATGFADVEAELPMEPTSRMLAASIGKTFVAATLLDLQNGGALGLDDPLHKFLGDRKWFNRLPNHAEISLRHLLTHSSGLPDHIYSEAFAAAMDASWRSSESPLPPEALVSFILDEEPLFPAGQGWSYTDTGYILLGFVIEEVTGGDYYDEVVQRFLEPLGLADTIPSDHRNIPGLVPGYMAEDNPFGFPPKSIGADGRMLWHPGLEWTGGGFASTSRDLAVWGRALFNGKAMTADYLETMLAGVPMNSDDESVRYGTAVVIDESASYGIRYGHGGWIPGYVSSLRHYPKAGVTISFQINTDIGLMGGPVLGEIEEGLARAVMDAGER